MKDKNDILTQTFRKRLKDHEQPVRSELWASIEEDLKISALIARRRTLWRYAGIAASFLLILGLGTIYYVDSRMKGDQSSDSYAEKEITTIQKDEIVAENLEQTGNVQSDNVHTGEQKVAVAKTVARTEAKPAIELPVQPENVRIIAEQKEEKQLADRQAPDKEEDPITKKVQNIDNKSTDDNGLWNYPQHKKSKNKGMAYALAVGNSGQSLNFSAGDVQGESRIYNYAEDSKSHAYMNPPSNINMSSPPPPTDYNFDLPVSVGFTVRKHFSKILALESGLVYTYLSSEEKINEYTSPTIKNIQLHYLGIPVKLVYSFYNTNRLSVYVLGGGMAEKVIYGKAKTNRGGNITNDKLNIPELQWSLSGNVGVNYRLIDHLGLFIEPGVGYYFDDGSDVMTIRKDTPFNFTLQGGIRVTY